MRTISLALDSEYFQHRRQPVLITMSFQIADGPPAPAAPSPPAHQSTIQAPAPEGSPGPGPADRVAHDRLGDPSKRWAGGKSLKSFLGRSPDGAAI